MYSNTANFRGAHTMNFAKYWRHHLTLHPPNNQQNLEEMVSLIKEHNADIIGMGEIDKCTHWSARINQPKYLSERLNFHSFYGQNYTSPAPWLYTANTGNAVLSRFPIDRHFSKNISFEHSNLFECLTTQIGSKKFIHAIHNLPNNKFLHVVCTHFSTSFRTLRNTNALDIIKYFKENILPLHKSCGDSYIFMGDLNTVPLYSQKRHGFIDSDEKEATKTNKLVDKIMQAVTNKVEEVFPDDYRKDYTMRFLRHSGLFKSTMHVDPFNQKDIDDGRYHTYPQKPNRMIDYIFVSPDIKTTDVETIKVGFSDHRVIKTVVFVPD